MLNEEKIRLMTKAASFEAGEGKKALEMNRFYKGDYLTIHLIGAWISYTVAFCLCVGLWAFIKWNTETAVPSSRPIPPFTADKKSEKKTLFLRKACDFSADVLY